MTSPASAPGPEPTNEDEEVVSASATPGAEALPTGDDEPDAKPPTK